MFKRGIPSIWSAGKLEVAGCVFWGMKEGCEIGASFFRVDFAASKHVLSLKLRSYLRPEVMLNIFNKGGFKSLEVG